MPLYVRTMLLTGPLDQTAAASSGHLDHLRQLKLQGRLRLAGRLPRADGFLEIFEAADLLEAEETARASPVVEQGLGAWTLREWEELDV